MEAQVEMWKCENLVILDNVAMILNYITPSDLSPEGLRQLRLVGEED